MAMLGTEEITYPPLKRRLRLGFVGGGRVASITAKYDWREAGTGPVSGRTAWQTDQKDDFHEH